MTHTYKKGLYEVRDGLYAWMLPDGGWGWSNSGLIVGEGESLVVDTLFDLNLTKEMIEGYRSIVPREDIKFLFNTHANGDHYFGNELLKDATIIATKAAAECMTAEEVEKTKVIKSSEGPAGDFVRHVFSPFDFDPVIATGPNIAFENELHLNVGGRRVNLIEVGPAHTPGDAIAYLPDDGVVYAGDILFIGGTPIIWAGPVENWIIACDRLIALDADTYIPGHGPITGKSGVKEVRDYLLFIKDEAEDRYRRGMSISDAIIDIDLGDFKDLNDKERLAQNVVNVYLSMDPDSVDIQRSEVFQAMAYLDGYGDMPSLGGRK